MEGASLVPALIKKNIEWLRNECKRISSPVTDAHDMDTIMHVGAVAKLGPAEGDPKRIVLTIEWN